MQNMKIYNINYLINGLINYLINYLIEKRVGSKHLRTCNGPGGPARALQGPGPAPRALACVTNACDELFFQLNSFTQSVFQVTFQIFHWRKDDVFNQIGKGNPRNWKRQPQKIKQNKYLLCFSGCKTKCFIFV